MEKGAAPHQAHYCVARLVLLLPVAIKINAIELKPCLSLSFSLSLFFINTSFETIPPQHAHYLIPYH